MKKRLVTALVAIVMAVVLTACGGKSNSVVGTWVVKEYNLDGETVSKSKIQDYLGEMAAQNNDYELVFTASGNLVITSPNFATGGTNEDEAAYTVQEGNIEVYDPDDPTDFELIEYDGEHILIDMGGYTIIMEKE